MSGEPRPIPLSDIRNSLTAIQKSSQIPEAPPLATNFWMQTYEKDRDLMRQELNRFTQSGGPLARHGSWESLVSEEDKISSTSSTLLKVKKAEEEVASLLATISN